MQHQPLPEIKNLSGISSLLMGAKLLALPQFRPFIIIPLIINLVLFVVLTGVLIYQFSDAFGWMMGWLPDWDWLNNFLGWILWPLFASVILLVYGYSFSMITNLIAAPFNGILAEKIEAHLTGVAPDTEPLSRMIPRTLLRELLKLWYFISRGLLIVLAMFLLSFIPGLNLVVGLLWGAWSMAIQYIDYPADNHQMSFSLLRKHLWKQPFNSFSFGGVVMLGNMIPLVNIFVMPVAVAGATVYWVQSDGVKALPQKP